MHYPRPPHRPQAYRVPAGSRRRYVARGGPGTPAIFRAVRALVHGREPARLTG